MELNEKLQELRKQKGLTQEELSRALYVSRTAVSKWESGRGYPSIDSLKALARFYAITVDELLSGDELLTIAEEDVRQREGQLRDVVFGLLDCSTVMLLFLPFFGQRAEEIVRSTALISLTGIAPWLKAAYLAAVVVLIVWGVLALALQNVRQVCRHENKGKVSVALNAAAALLFIAGRQPYAASFLCAVLFIKAWMLFRGQ